MCVYGLFKAQAKTNSKDNANYIEANKLLDNLNGKKGFIPISPKQKAVRDWTTKGAIVLLTTALESIVIGTLILNWDLMTFLSCMTSSITAVLFGIVAMIKDEVYWTEDYLLYAQYVTEQHDHQTSLDVKDNHSSTTAAGLGAAAPYSTPPEPMKEVPMGEQDESLEENSNA